MTESSFMVALPNNSVERADSAPASRVSPCSCYWATALALPGRKQNSKRSTVDSCNCRWVWPSIAKGSRDLPMSTHTVLDAREGELQQTCKGPAEAKDVRVCSPVALPKPDGPIRGFPSGGLTPGTSVATRCSSGMANSNVLSPQASSTVPEEFLMAEASLPSTLLKMVAQVLGAQAACALTQRCWTWELSELHMLQSLMSAHCSSSLRTSVLQGTLVEGACTFFFHLSLLRLQHSLLVYRVPALALLVTVMAYTAGPYTSAFFNPALAASVTFHCSGNTLLEYAHVYCLGPVAGMILAVLLHQGHLPRLFQRNLFYRQKTKYRTPRGKLCPTSLDTQIPTKECSGKSL